MEASKLNYRIFLCFTNKKAQQLFEFASSGHHSSSHIKRPSFSQQVVEDGGWPIDESPNILEPRGKQLYNPQPNRVCSVSATLLLQALQHAVLRQATQHVRFHKNIEYSKKKNKYCYYHKLKTFFTFPSNNFARYGFHKVQAVDSGGLKSERVEGMEFAHTCFLRGHENLLESIKRKASNKSVNLLTNISLSIHDQIWFDCFRVVELAMAGSHSELLEEQTLYQPPWETKWMTSYLKSRILRSNRRIWMANGKRWRKKTKHFGGRLSASGESWHKIFVKSQHRY